MTEALFSLSIGFFAYVVYAFVDEQRKSNRKVAESKPRSVTAKPAKPAKPQKPKKPAKTAVAKPKKPAAKATAKKKVAPTANLASEAIMTYLGKNGLTTVAKLTSELPGTKKTIRDSIDQLIRDGKLSQSKVGRALAIEIKG